MDFGDSDQPHLSHKHMKTRSNDDGNDMEFLPKCNGPKLQPFQNPNTTIEFKDLISKSDLTDSFAGLGGHAHVFEISIQSKTYALKIVRQRSWHNFERC